MTFTRRVAWSILSAALLCFGVGNTGAAEPLRGPLCVWTFDDTLRDETGRGRDQLSARDGSGRVMLPRFVTADEVPGVLAKAVALGVRPGDLAFMTACTSPDVRLGATYTIALWIHPTEVGVWGRLVLHWGGGGQHAYHVAVHNGLASLYHGQADGKEAVCEGGRIVTGRWHHIAAVAERNEADPAKSTLRIYLDGQCVGTAVFDGTIRTLEGEGLGVGDAAGAPSEACRFRGYVDDVMIWNRALTAEQIAALCAQRAKALRELKRKRTP